MEGVGDRAGRMARGPGFGWAAGVVPGMCARERATKPLCAGRSGLKVELALAYRRTDSACAVEALRVP